MATRLLGCSGASIDDAGGLHRRNSKETSTMRKTRQIRPQLSDRRRLCRYRCSSMFFVGDTMQNQAISTRMWHTCSDCAEQTWKNTRTRTAPMILIHSQMHLTASTSMQLQWLYQTSTILQQLHGMWSGTYVFAWSWKTRWLHIFFMKPGLCMGEGPAQAIYIRYHRLAKQKKDMLASECHSEVWHDKKMAMSFGRRIEGIKWFVWISVVVFCLYLIWCICRMIDHVEILILSPRNVLPQHKTSHKKRIQRCMRLWSHYMISWACPPSQQYIPNNHTIIFRERIHARNLPQADTFFTQSIGDVDICTAPWRDYTRILPMWVHVTWDLSEIYPKCRGHNLYSKSWPKNTPNIILTHGYTYLHSSCIRVTHHTR